jgi:hypothetical protein
MGSAAGYSRMAQLFPDHPLAAQWREYADSVWRDWYEQADTDENSLHYHAVWWEYVIDYAMNRHAVSADHGPTRSTLLDDPRVKRLFARYRDQLSPLGAMPPYGDCYGWGFEWGGWVLLFETAATQTGDGTFKQAAARVFDFLLQEVKNVPPHLASYEDMAHLASAYLYTSDDVPLRDLPTESKLLMRKELFLLPVPERKEKKTWFTLGPGEIPDKLVLRSGADGLYAAFDLLPLAGHGHSSAPALVALTDHDTALLTDTCYEDRLAEDHSLLYLKRLHGGRVISGPPTRLTVTQFTRRPDLAYCATEMTDYAGWGTRLRRAMFLAKGRFLWVADEAQFAQPMTVSVGPLWQAGEVAARGPNWFDVTWNEPRGFLWTWRNGDRRLLVFFVPRQQAVVGCQYQAWKTQRAVQQWSPPYCLYQKQAGYAAEPGAQLRFDTILIPHGPAEDPAALAGSITAGSSPGCRWVKLSRDGRVIEAAVQDGKPEVK